MRRRAFLRAGGALGAAGALGAVEALGAVGALGTTSVRRDALGAVSAGPGGSPPDLVLRCATVYDGIGGPGVEADVAVTADRITAVGRIAEAGAEEIDLAGMALAPGFIDIHSHADLSLLVNPKAESRIRQGITLEIVGQDGSSVGPWSEAGFQATKARYRESYGVEIDFRDLGGFLDRLDRTPATVNLATMVGHGTVRGLVVGSEDRPATEAELIRMRGLVQAALEQGAVGLSSGLEYTPGSFAATSELVELARALEGTGYPYASHMRNEDDRLFAAIEEAIHVGLVAGVPVQISHLKAQGRRNYWKAEAALSLELAVHKVTALPATKLGLEDRGVIRTGAYADLVVFDPMTVADGATFEAPHQYPVGIPLVVVNGQVTLREGEQTGIQAGRAIRGRGATG